MDSLQELLDELLALVPLSARTAPISVTVNDMSVRINKVQYLNGEVTIECEDLELDHGTVDDDDDEDKVPRL